MLLHFTRSFEALASIVGLGFFYLHNETGVLGPAANKAFGIGMADEQSSGMICFTELHPRETRKHRDTYGQFGVGVNKDWLVQRGARKVTYVEIGSSRYEDYVSRLRSLAPKLLHGRPMKECIGDPQTRFQAMLALTKPTWSARAGADEAYVKLLDHLQWTQTSRSVAEREWRVRNPRPYALKGRPTRKETIDLFTHCIENPQVPMFMQGMMQLTLDMKTVLMFSGKAALVLTVPLAQIEAVFCTPEYVSAFHDTFANHGARHIKVIT